jgi:hypothetical protein
VGPVRRRRGGRPPGTKDSDQKARDLWLAVKLKRGRNTQLSVDEAGRQVARKLAKIDHKISGSTVSQNYRKVEKRRRADPAFAKQLDDLLASVKPLDDLHASIAGGDGAFVPTGFRNKVLERRVARISPMGKLDHRSHFVPKNKR